MPRAPFIPKGRLTRRMINRLHLMMDYTIQITRQAIKNIRDEFKTYPDWNNQRTPMLIGGLGNGPGEGAHTGHNLAGASLELGISWSRFPRRSFVGRDVPFVTFLSEKVKEKNFLTEQIESPKFLAHPRLLFLKEGFPAKSSTRHFQ